MTLIKFGATLKKSLCNRLIICVVCLSSCLALSLFLWLRNPFIGTDGYIYATVGHNFLTGNGFTYAGIPHLIFHPLYPLLIGIFSLLVDNLETAAYLATLLPYLIAILLVYYLSGFFFDTEGKKWASALLVGFHPEMIKYSASIMSETVFTTTLLIMFIGALKLADKDNDNNIFWALIFGLGGGLAYLTRPEGLLYFAVLALFVFIRSAKIKTIGKLSLSALILLFVALPWIIYLSSHFGRPTLTGKSQINMAARGYAKASESKAHLASLPTLDGTRTFYEYPPDISITPEIDHVPERYIHGIIHNSKDIRFFFGYVGLIIFFIGLAALLKNNRFSLALLFLFIPSLMFPLFIFPVESRFLVPVIPCFAIGVCSGWITIGRMAKSKWRLSRSYHVAALVIVAVIVHGYWYAMISNRTVRIKQSYREIKNISLEIGRNCPEIQNASIVARRGWVPFYLGAPHRMLPWYDTIEGLVDYMMRNEIDYIYLQKDKDEKYFPQYSPVIRSCREFGLQPVFEKGNHALCKLKTALSNNP